MAHWLLLTDINETTGVAIELIPGRLSKAPGTQSFDIALNPDKDDDLFDSAKTAGLQAFWLLKGEGYLHQSLSLRFQLAQIPAGIAGHSADLLFALAVTTKARPCPEGYPHFAATGVLDDKGWVQDVKGIPAKLRAAITTMDKSLVGQTGERLLFYPQANNSQIDQELREYARSLGFELCPVSRLDEAVARLGIVIRKVYLDNPYRGLEEFRYEHRGIYFGRQAEIIEMTKRLLAREQAGYPGILILAASGAGKSSLVQAGLIPALEDNEQIQQSRHLLWQIWKPSDTKGHGLTDLLNSIRDNWQEKFGDIISPDSYQNISQTDNLVALADVLANIVPQNRRFLWMVNQLEELFTLGFPDGVINKFTEFLRHLQNLGIWVVATLRNDFYPHYQKHSALVTAFGTLDGEYKLGPLDSSALEQIIRNPAELAGLTFATDASGFSLAARIQKDVAGETDALPLLEFALTELYKRCKGEQILTSQAYEDIGELKGAIGKSADEIYQKLYQEEQAETSLRKVLWALSKSGRGNGEQLVTSQGASLDDFPKGSTERKLIDRFIEKRLLVRDENNVRVAHEALLNYWPTAQMVINGFLRDMQVRDRLIERVEEWKAKANDSSLLLPAGLPLSESQDLLNSMGGLLDLNSELVSYIKASIQANEEKARQEQENKRKRTVRTRLVALIILVVAAVALSFYIQLNKSNDETQSRQLANESRRLFRTNPEQARLLAIEAYRIHESPLTYSSLYEAFLHNPKLQQTIWIHNNNLKKIGFDVKGRLLAASYFNGVVQLLEKNTGLEIARLKGPFFDFSPDGRNILTAGGKDGTAHFWDIEKKQEAAVLKGHEQPISALTYSPNGNMVATGSSDETVRIWDTVTHQQNLVLNGHTGPIKVLSFSPDGKYLVSSSEYGPARIWDVLTGEEIALLKGHSGTVKKLQFSPDGQLLATFCDGDATVRLWNVANWQKIAEFPHQASSINDLTFSQDSQTLIVAGEDGNIHLWDIVNKSERAALQDGHSSHILKLAVSPDGNLLVSAGMDSTIQIWNIANAQKIESFNGHTLAVRDIAFTSDGHSLASASSDGTIRFWDIAKKQELAVRKVNQFGSPFAFSPDGQLLATVGDHNAIEIINGYTGHKIATLPGHPRTVTDMAWSPDGHTLATAGRDRRVRLWDAPNQRKIADWATGNSTPDNIAFNPDGSLLATGGKPGRLWRVGTENSIVIEGQQHIYGILFSPHDPILAVSGQNSNVRLIDTEDGHEIGELDPATAYMSTAAAFSPNGHMLAIKSQSSSMWLFDTQSRELIAELNSANDCETNRDNDCDSKSPFFDAAFSPNGHILATAQGKKVRLWDVASDNISEAASLSGHSDRIFSLAFSNDGHFLATASEDNTLKLWDTESKRAISTMQGHTKGVYKVIFNPKGQTMATGSYDGTVRLWQCDVCRPPKEIIDLLKKRAGRSLSEQERSQFGLSN